MLCTIPIQQAEVTNWLISVRFWFEPNFSYQMIAYRAKLTNVMFIIEIMTPRISGVPIFKSSLKKLYLNPSCCQKKCLTNVLYFESNSDFALNVNIYHERISQFQLSALKNQN